MTRFEEKIITALIIIGLIVWIFVKFWYVITALIIIILVIKLAQKIEKEKEIRAISEADVDIMDGIDFEYYVKRLLDNIGYSCKVTSSSKDYGVDIIAIKDGDRYAVQVKRMNSNVSRKAVSDAVAGMVYYKCNKSMVVTNSYFTKGALNMANKTHTVLIDRSELSKLILKYKR